MREKSYTNFADKFVVSLTAIAGFTGVMALIWFVFILAER